MARAKPLNKRIQSEAYRIVYWQLAAVLSLASLVTLAGGTLRGFSVLAGGMAYGLPNLLFVWRVFRYAGAQQMNLFMAAFFFGEMIKLFLSGILFLLVVKYLPISLLSVGSGFITAIVAFWIVCLVRFSKTKGVAK